MTESVQSQLNRYTRAETMKALGICSRTTLNDYCNKLGILRGLRYFTQEEFEQLQELRVWCERGGRKADYLKYRRELTATNRFSSQTYFQVTSKTRIPQQSSSKKAIA